MVYGRGAFLGLCLACLAWCSDLKPCSMFDLEVVLSRPPGRHAHVFLQSSVINVNDIRGCPQTDYSVVKASLFSVMHNEMLAGYRFIPAIDKGSWRDEAWWSSSVRDRVCTQEPFYSDQLKLCCDAMEAALSREDVFRKTRVSPATTRTLWKALDAQCMKKNFYPEGFTRLWTIVPASSVGAPCLKNQVFFRFYKADIALRGVLVKRIKTMGSVAVGGKTEPFYSGEIIAHDWAENPKCRNLGFLKKIKEAEKKSGFFPVESMLKKAKSLDFPSLENILHPAYSGQWDVCIEYHPRPGLCRCGFFIGSKIEVSVGSKKCPLSQVLRDEVWEGLAIKNAGKLSEKEIRILKRPEVRDVFCTRMSWKSQTIKACLRSLCLFWWGGFRDETGSLLFTDVQGVVKATEKNAKVVWSILDKETLKRVRSGAKTFKERMVLIGVQKEECALMGRVFPLRPWERMQRD